MSSQLQMGRWITSREKRNELQSQTEEDTMACISSVVRLVSHGGYQICQKIGKLLPKQAGQLFSESDVFQADK